MADWVSPSVFGTKFVCKLMAASRSDGCKAAVMSPVGDVVSPMGEVMARRASSDVPAGGDGCYAAVTSTKSKQPTEGAEHREATQPAQCAHNLGKADIT